MFKYPLPHTFTPHVYPIHYQLRLTPSPIHRHVRVTRVNDLIRVVTLHAAVVAFGSLTYLVGCGVYGAKTTPEFDIDFH